MRLLDTGEPDVEALKFKSETLVVDPHTVQDGSVHVVDMHRVFDDVVAVLIGPAVDAAAFDAAANHPDREATAVVVAAVAQPSLAVAGAPELAAPDH